MDFRSLRAALFAVVAVLGFTAAAAPDPRLGSKAPAFALADAGGKEVTLRRFAGRPLVMNVFASWCPPCRLELPRIVAAAHAHTAVAFLGVDEQEPQSMAVPFIKAMKLPYGVVFDQGQFQASYGAASLPETVFVDRSGRVAAIVHGVISTATLAADLAKIERAAQS